MKLFGILNPVFPSKSFCIPIFTLNERFYIQKIENNKIIAFEQSPTPRNGIIKCETTEEYNVADSAVYAFFFESNDWKVTSKEKLNNILLSRLSELEKYPFLLSEIGSFLNIEAICKRAEILMRKKISTEIIVETITVNDGGAKKIYATSQPEARVNIKKARSSPNMQYQRKSIYK